MCRNLLIGSFSSLADEELNVNKIIYTQTQVWFVLTNHLCFIRALKRFDTLLENASVWRSDALKKEKRPDGQRCDVKFYFYIKYINKASAGGIRSMCTFSDTHMYVCRTQTHRQAYTPHNINQNDGSCSHLGTQTGFCLHQCQHPTQVTWSLEAPQQFSLTAPAAMIFKKCFNNSKISRTRSHDTMLVLSQ